MTRISLRCMILCLLISSIIKHSREYENIAFEKPTWQASTHDGYSSYKAVDGLKKNLSAAGNKCSISLNEKTKAEWWVNLGNILSIRYILVYYRTENIEWDFRNPFTSRFLGFSLYISNTTNRNEGHLCFHDTNYTIYTIPPMVNISCPIHGQYVIYYNERLEEIHYPANYSQYAFNELCEVEVYGCPVPGYYGASCSFPCPYVNCGYCDIETGECLDCKAGYRGHMCKLVCGTGFYGISCSEPCGNCSNGETCHPIHGFCTNGCDFGVFGEKCDKSCPMGFYGKNCSLFCDHCDTCDRFTGRCYSQCYTGWAGSFCTEECTKLTYGLECKERCGKCLNGRQCHHINGSCLEGCDAGFLGKRCETDTGLAPAFATIVYNVTRDVVCEVTIAAALTLTPSEYGIKPKCMPGKYGINCGNTCSVHCSVTSSCNTTTGQCEGGCKSGWKGDACKEECDIGKYGQECADTCGKCHGQLCHHVTGFCTNGCEPGYKGVHCNEVCDFGYFGDNCKEDCSTFCKVPRDCYHENGFCKNGCKSGWQGLSCMQSLSMKVTDYGSRFYGMLAALCLCIIVILILITLQIFHWRRTKAKETPKNSKKNTISSQTNVIDVHVKTDGIDYQELTDIESSLNYNAI